MSQNPEILILRGEYITLTQLMKSLNWVGGGSEAHIFITEGLVKVNGKVETQKRKKLHVGDVVDFEGQRAQVVE